MTRRTKRARRAEMPRCRCEHIQLFNKSVVRAWRSGKGEWGVLPHPETGKPFTLWIAPDTAEETIAWFLDRMTQKRVDDDTEFALEHDIGNRTAPQRLEQVEPWRMPGELQLWRMFSTCGDDLGVIALDRDPFPFMCLDRCSKKEPYRLYSDNPDTYRGYFTRWLALIRVSEGAAEKYAERAEPNLLKSIGLSGSQK
ncbi:MAG TPA: hypothetical protein VIJ42_01890 [Stellaceae bacterium]